MKVEAVTSWANTPLAFMELIVVIVPELLKFPKLSIQAFVEPPMLKNIEPSVPEVLFPPLTVTFPPAALLELPLPPERDTCPPAPVRPLAPPPVMVT